MENRSVRREEQESASYACRERGTSPRNRDAKLKTLVKDTVCESSLTETELRLLVQFFELLDRVGSGTGAMKPPLYRCGAPAVYSFACWSHPSVCDHGGRSAVRRESSALGVYDSSWRNNGALVPATYRSRSELCIQRLLSTPERDSNGTMRPNCAKDQQYGI